MATEQSTPKLISRKEAKENSETYFFTGIECPSRGHISPRYTSSGGCVACSRVIYARDLDKILVKVKAWNKEHHVPKPRKGRKSREAKNEVRRRHRAANATRINEQRKIRHDTSEFREKANIRHAKWREENIERQRIYWAAYMRAHPESRAGADANRRARLRGSDGKHTKREIMDLLIAQDHKCANPYCRADIKRQDTDKKGQRRKSLDHILAVANGGSNTIDNLQWLCVQCNSSKNVKFHEEWLETQRRLYEKKEAA